MAEMGWVRRWCLRACVRQKAGPNAQDTIAEVFAAYISVMHAVSCMTQSKLEWFAKVPSGRFAGCFAVGAERSVRTGGLPSRHSPPSPTLIATRLKQMRLSVLYYELWQGCSQ